ncbi:hypothetical protein ACETU7_04425 [Rhodococcus sp. 3Y1]
MAHSTANCATVGASNNSLIDKFNDSESFTRATARAATRLFPPISKKLS